MTAGQRKIARIMISRAGAEEEVARDLGIRRTTVHKQLCSMRKELGMRSTLEMIVKIIFDAKLLAHVMEIES